MSKKAAPSAQSLEELAKWLEHTANEAWLAQRSAAGLRFLLGNLVLQMHANGQVDGPALIAGLRESVDQVPLDIDRQAIRQLLDELSAHLPGGPESEAPPDGAVFH